MKRVVTCLIALLFTFLFSQSVFAIAPDHVWSEWTITKQPTCTESGRKTRFCTADPDNPHSEQEIIPAFGHNYTVEAKAPTCTEDGEAIYTCTRCGSVKHEKTENALGHNYSAQITKEASCTENGIKTFVCTRCGESYTEDIPSIGHDYELTNTTQADCQHEGIHTYTCKNCGDTYTEIFAPKANHSFEEKIYQEGYFVHTDQVCKVCGHKEELTVQISTISVVSTAVGGIDFAVLSLFVLLLVPDFYVLIWYKKRKKKVLEQGQNK